MTVPVILVTPFLEPPNTFRATRLTDMFRVVPTPQKYWNALGTAGASFIYDVGLDPQISSLIFTFQNRTVSHTLRVELDLPPYLRSDLGTIFDVPAIGDTTTPPVAMEQYAGPGKGLINIVISFSEPQALTFVPGTFEDFIVFTIRPLDVAGPVFVDKFAPFPIDLNKIITSDDTVPRDDDKVTPKDEEPKDKNIIEVPVFIDREVEVPIEVNKWVDGTDGKSKTWPPPPGWSVGNDGRMYPPVPPAEVCDTTGTTRDPADVPESERTPLERLLFESKDIPASFGQNTKRRGYVIDIEPLLDGFNTGRATGRTIELLVADSDDQSVGFKIINYKKTFRNGQTVPNPVTNDEMKNYFEKSNLYTGYIKQGVNIPGSPFSLDKLAVLSIRDSLSKGKKIFVKDDDDEAQLRRIRLYGNVMALVKDIETNGEGKSV